MNSDFPVLAEFMPEDLIGLNLNTTMIIQLVQLALKD